MKYKNLLKIIKESASIGSTCAANISVSPSNLGFISRNSIGVGFDPDGDYGVYPNPKKKKDKKKNKNKS